MDANAELAKYKERDERRKQSQKKYRDAIRDKKKALAGDIDDETKKELRLKKKKDYMKKYNTKRKEIKKSSNDTIDGLINIVLPLFQSGEIDKLSFSELIGWIEKMIKAVKPSNAIKKSVVKECENTIIESV